MSTICTGTIHGIVLPREAPTGAETDVSEVWIVDEMTEDAQTAKRLHEFRGKIVRRRKPVKHSNVD